MNYLREINAIFQDEELTDFSWINNLTEVQSYPVFYKERTITFFKNLPLEIRKKVFIKIIVILLDGMRDFISNSTEHCYFVGVYFQNWSDFSKGVSLIPDTRLIIDPDNGACFIDNLQFVINANILFDINKIVNEDLVRPDVVFGQRIDMTDNLDDHEIWAGYLADKIVSSVGKYCVVKPLPQQG